MKKILLLFYLIIFYSLNAQTYTFDYKIIFASKHTKKTSYFLNSKASSYDIHLFNKRGSLRDNKEKKIIVYSFKYLKHNEKKYDFTNVEEFTPKDEFNISKITVEKLDENKYLIKSFEKENSTETNLELTVNLKPFETDLIRFYLLDLSQNIRNKITTELKEHLGNNYNYYISEYIIDYRNGIKRHLFAEKVEPIDLKITTSE